jgi:hypothetical protein
LHVIPATQEVEIVRTAVLDKPWQKHLCGLISMRGKKISVVVCASHGHDGRKHTIGGSHPGNLDKLTRIKKGWICGSSGRDPP